MLSEGQVSFFRENGYLLAEGMLSTEEATLCREECHALTGRLARSFDIDATWESARHGPAPAVATQVLHCHNVQFYSALLARLIVDERFTSAAARLIGSENVQLHHTKMFIKPPERGSPFPLHQDCPFFPHEHHTMTAAVFHFDDAPVEKGCLRVVPGSHKLGPLQHSPEGGWHLPFEQYPIESATPCPAKAGDVLFFSYLTIHGSSINSSHEARTTLLVQFRDPEDRPAERTHVSRGQGMMLQGVDPHPVPQFEEPP